MCKRIITNRLVLGSREIGWEAWSLPKGEIVEFTSAQLKNLIKQGKDEVYGLKLGRNNELEFDTEGFFTTNMMNKAHINNLTPMIEGESLVNLFYVVIGTHKQNGSTMYDVISSRFESTSFNEEKLKVLLSLGVISGGAKLENDKIIVAPLEKVQQEKEEKTPVEKKAEAEKKVATATAEKKETATPKAK